MYSLDNAFNELLERIKDPDSLNPAKSDPVFYLAYPPDKMLEIKNSLRRWISRIKGNNYSVKRISLSEMLWETIDESGRWDIWLELEDEAEPDQINEAVCDVLRQGNAFVSKIINEIESTPEGTVILLTEGELLHPFFRTRTIESCLHDRVKNPTVIFYPGRRSGQYGLHFLGFYPVDGNYRSTLLGGL